MSDDEKVNPSHPAKDSDKTASERSALIIQQTTLAVEEAVKEFKEDKAKIKLALMEGRLQKEPETYSGILTETFGAEFTNRFYGSSTMSKDGLQSGPRPPLIEAPLKTDQEILSNAMNAFTNMHMAHEICINPSFQLKPPEKLDTLENRVNIQMKRAFWSIVDEDLAQQPPVYDQALKVFEEIKDKLLDLLLPHNTSIRMSIIENLNIEEIKREIKHDILDFFKYINFVVDCLAKLCSPSRDQQVNAIRLLETPSDIFSHLFDLMEGMQLDMANYLISIYRPKIQEHCISYERQRFIEFLQFEYGLKQDGLRNTREWLLRHRNEGRDSQRTIAKAFGEIISWDYNNPWPETLALDAIRLANIARVVKRATILGGMILSVLELCKPLFRQNYSNQSIFNQMKPELEEKFKILLPLDHMSDNKKVIDDSEACAEEAVRIVGKHFFSFDEKNLSESDASVMRHAVKDILNDENKVRSILMTRILQYTEELIFSEGRRKVPITAGLTLIQGDVETCCNEFSKIAYHNRNAYDDLYCDIIEGKCRSPDFNAESKDHLYVAYLHQLMTTPRSSNSMAQNVQKLSKPVEASKISVSPSKVEKFTEIDDMKSVENKPLDSNQGTSGINNKTKDSLTSVVPSNDLTMQPSSKDRIINDINLQSSVVPTLAVVAKNVLESSVLPPNPSVPNAVKSVDAISKESGDDFIPDDQSINNPPANPSCDEEQIDITENTVNEISSEKCAEHSNHIDTSDKNLTPILVPSASEASKIIAVKSKCTRKMKLIMDYETGEEVPRDCKVRLRKSSTRFRDCKKFSKKNISEIQRRQEEGDSSDTDISDAPLPVSTTDSKDPISSKIPIKPRRTQKTLVGQVTNSHSKCLSREKKTASAGDIKKASVGERKAAATLRSMNPSSISIRSPSNSLDGVLVVNTLSGKSPPKHNMDFTPSNTPKPSTEAAITVASKDKSKPSKPSGISRHLLKGSAGLPNSDQLLTIDQILSPFSLTSETTEDFQFGLPRVNQTVLDKMGDHMWDAPVCEKHSGLEGSGDWVDTADHEGENWRNLKKRGNL